MTQENDPLDAGLGADEFHRALHIERGLFPIDNPLVVHKARVPAQHHEAALRELGAGERAEIVRGPVGDKKGDVRRGALVGHIERSAHRAKIDVFGIALGVCFGEQR